MVSKEERKFSLSANPVGEHGFLFGPKARENQSAYLSPVLGLLKAEGIMFLQELRG